MVKKKKITSPNNKYIDFIMILVAISVVVIVFILQPHKTTNNNQSIDQECCNQFCHIISNGELKCNSFSGSGWKVTSDTITNKITCESSNNQIPFTMYPEFKIRNITQVCNKSNYINITKESIGD